MKALAVALLGWCVAAVHAYWMEDIAHEGYAPFAGDNYTVFRNVRDYGARGDGTTDDAAAINRAIADGDRCGPGCNGSTTTPALVYFPAGTYALAAPVTPWYLTQLVGDAGAPPTLRALPTFAGAALIDGNPYGANSTGATTWLPANVFYRQVRNFVLDTTAVAGTGGVTGVHWPTSQATSLQNLRFEMGRNHTSSVGLIVEAGSGGLLVDLAFVGGGTGARLGNQQFTARGLVFRGCRTGVRQVWDWGWTYAQLRFEGCGVGLDMGGDEQDGVVGSVTVVDSAFVDTPVAIRTVARNSTVVGAANATTAGSVVLENVAVTNVAAVVQAADGRVLLAGGADTTTTIVAWAMGHAYDDGAAQPVRVQGAVPANGRPAALLGPRAAAAGYRYYARSKPQYTDVPAARVLRARAAGAVGDGVADDTAALQRLFDQAAESSSDALVFLDHGLYRVTNTLTVAPGTRLVGEAYPVLLASTGADADTDCFGDAAHPQPLLRVGAHDGQPGVAELSDLVLATHGAQPGAVLVQWQLAAPAGGAPGGLWDVHTRVGGFTGSGLQDCRQQETERTCVGAFLALHITPGAAHVYAENVWLWTADHDLDDAAAARLTVRSGRGALVASARGPVWLVATAAEHHALYQYQLAGTQNVLVGHVQTETPYYQPETAVYPTHPDYGDPACAADACMAWGLRIVDTARVLVYGAGLYSFFRDYDQACLPSACQPAILSLERARDVRLYNLNTVGARSMVDVDGVAVAAAAAHPNRDTGTIAVYAYSGS